MEYQISVYAMKGLTSSEPVSIMEKTQPMKVQVGKLYHWVRNI
jgi:collagen type XII alpha